MHEAQKEADVLTAKEHPLSYLPKGVIPPFVKVATTLCKPRGVAPPSFISRLRIPGMIVPPYGTSGVAGRLIAPTLRILTSVYNDLW